MFYDENGNFDEEAHGASLEAYEKELAEFDEIRRLMKARDAVRDRAQARKAREDEEVKRRDAEQRNAARATKDCALQPAAARPNSQTSAARIP